MTTLPSAGTNGGALCICVANSTVAGAPAIAAVTQASTSPDPLDRVEEEAGADRLRQRVQPQPVADHDAEELRPAAAHRPEHVRVLDALARISRPSAITTSTASTLWQARPQAPEFQPKPPPSR